jgi:hypothetical protein
MASKMGQSVMDRVTAAKHTIAGQGLAKTVCKATTEEVMGPKRKHLDCKYCLLTFYSMSVIFALEIKKCCSLIMLGVLVLDPTLTENMCEILKI